MATLDPSGHVVEWTRGLERLLGSDAASYVGRPIAAIYSPHDVAEKLPNRDLQHAESAGGLHGERRLRRADGSDLWASLDISALRDEHGLLHGFGVLVCDLTERRYDDDGLQPMLELAQNAKILVNAAGKIVSANTQIENMFGYHRRQLVGEPVEILVPDRFKRNHPRDRDGYFANPVVRPMGAGRDLYGRRSDGSEFPVEIGLSPIETADGPAVLASIVDITERKRAEERFRVAVESAPNAMVMVNRDGAIVLVNLQTERLFGYTRDELLGASVDMLVPDRFRDQHPANRSAFFSTPTVRSMGAGRDLFGRRKDGTEFPVEIGLNPIQTDNEMFVLSAIVDITARKQAEEQARRHLADLAHVARLSTVGQMFSELAHEINQPLAAAANYARACVTFARTNGATQEQMVDWMQKTVDQTTRAIDIVKRLGSFVKKDGGLRARMSINRTIEQVVSSSVPAIRTPSGDGVLIQLELKLDRTIPDIHADAVQLEQVLLNLVRNAIEAMQEAAIRPPRLVIQTTQDSKQVTVAVTDNGPGISPENLRRLFDPYFTTKATGMGLGLSISRSIVEDHQGKVEVDSSSAGTTFRFTLPKASQDATP